MKNLLVIVPLLLLSLNAFALEVEFEQDRTLPLVYLNVAINTGTVTDPKGQSGISNFMGEMLLRGTRSRTKEQIDLALDQMGAQLEVETRAEALILRGAVLSEKLDEFLRLMDEVITQPSFPPHEIRKLKSEMVSALLAELGNDQALVGKHFNRFLFSEHPYGKPILGTIPDVKKLTRDQVVKQYELLFTRQLMLVVGTGHADPGRIDAWAQGVAKSRPQGSPVGDLVAPKTGTQRRLLIVDKPDRTQTQIAAGQIGVRMTDPEFFPLYLANHAFGGGSFSARMMVEIRVKRGWSYGAYSYFRHGTKPRSWQYTLFPATSYTPEALSYSLGMMKELKEKGITAKEFEFAKTSLVNSAGFMFNTPKKRVENTLLERTLDLPKGFMKTFGPKLAQVTPQQVSSALTGFLQPDNLAIVVVGTAKDIKEPLAKAAGVPLNEVKVVPYTAE